MNAVTGDDQIVRLDPSALDGLADLLAEVVDDGASVGFLAPLDRAEALAWWTARAADPHQATWVAYDGPRVVGTIGLTFPGKPNSAHRAELVKLMVGKAARGKGLGRRLLAVAEEGAVAAGVTLLHLDTETDSPAERLYAGTGWTRAGVIPDYAANPGGVLHPTTLYYKRIGASAAEG
ncbi:GNAT family N-acetyltransferase [Streptomyces sp. S6]